MSLFTNKISRLNQNFGGIDLENIIFDSGSIKRNINSKGNIDFTHSMVNGLDHILDHNLLKNYNANSHIDHSNIYILPGNGLNGGGTINSNISIEIDINNLTEDQSPNIFTNYIMSYDNQTSNLKKILLKNATKSKMFKVFPEIRSIKSSNWYKVATFEYEGSDCAGPINAITIVGRKDNNNDMSSYDVLVVSADQNLTIASGTFNNTTLAINDLGVIGNVPSNSSLIEILVKGNGSKREIYIQECTIHHG